MASGSSHTNTRIKVLSREIRLTYLQSQQVRGGGRSIGEIAGEGGGIGSVTSGSSNPGSPGFLGIGASAPSSITRTANDSGWQISRVWEETSFDKIRYAIGIRDIGAYHYTFAPRSELISTEWKAPKEISKVQLRVIEQIPAALPLDKQWLQYYVSPDLGGEWYRINPLDHPTVIGEGGLVVPKTITFNPDFGGEPAESDRFVETAEPVRSLIFRAVFFGPTTDDVEDPTRFTPILKQYRLLMYPVGGLRNP